jgi:hypothetical protein
MIDAFIPRADVDELVAAIDVAVPLARAGVQLTVTEKGDRDAARAAIRRLLVLRATLTGEPTITAPATSATTTGADG